jgi:predicted nucleotidyltransferase
MSLILLRNNSNINRYMTKDEMISICAERHIKRLSLFGSAQKGDFRQNSDIDLFEAQHIPSFF